MIESPVSIILGLNESMGFVLQNEYHKLNDKLLIVFLDENVFLIEDSLAKEIGKSIPVFGNFKNRLKIFYEILNPLPSTNFLTTKKSKKNQFVYKAPDLSKKYTKKNLNYAPTNKELNACEEIFKFMRNVFETNILKKIPTNPKTVGNDRNVLLKIINYYFFQGIGF